MNIRRSVLYVLILTSLVCAQNPNLGSSGAQFLKIPLGAREAGMAGAVIGLESDASSLFWNPAGLAKVKNVDLHFSYMKWFGLFDMNAAAAAYSLDEWGVIGASAVSFSTSHIEITNEENPNGIGEYYDAQDVAIGISYAKYLMENFNVGVTVKYINQSIWHESASGIAFDIGTQYHLDFHNLVIAMSMSNFGSDLQLSGSDLDVRPAANSNYPVSRQAPATLRTSEYSLPLSFEVGLGFDIYRSDFINIVGGIDAVHPNDNNERVHFGSEISVYDRFFIRGGYIYNHDTQNFALGAGVNIPSGNTLIDFSYAYSNYDILPGVHRISIGLKIL
jgi:hypothetical protein